MSDTKVVTASFPTLDAARSARRRIGRAGFARNSIDIERRRDEFELSISTRGENRQRLERILHGQSVQQTGGQADTARNFERDNPVATMGLAVFAGFVLFGLTNWRWA